MALALAKTYVIPAIVFLRTTVASDQCTVETPEYVDIVTVSGSNITCTYHQAHCSHIQAVEHRRTADTTKAIARSAYELLFDLSYGDILA